MPLFNLCSGGFHGRFETAGRLLPQPYDCKGRKAAIRSRGSRQLCRIAVPFQVGHIPRSRSGDTSHDNPDSLPIDALGD